MTDSSRPDKEEVLDQDVVGVVASAIAPGRHSPERLRRLRERVMSRIDESAPSMLETIRGSEGEWIELQPQIEKKLLHFDEETGVESYLLRLQPGAKPMSHEHDSDELCVVLEGDLSFGDLRLEAGDFHYARKGSRHVDMSTVDGAVLFLQAKVGSVRPTA